VGYGWVLSEMTVVLPMVGVWYSSFLHFERTKKAKNFYLWIEAATSNKKPSESVVKFKVMIAGVMAYHPCLVTENRFDNLGNVKSMPVVGRIRENKYVPSSSESKIQNATDKLWWIKLTCSCAGTA
jgi:hypothetical protein